jgi:hypothetical protein
MSRRKSLLTPAKQFITKNQSNIKLVLIVLVSLVAMYWMIRLFTPKPQMPAEYKIQLDMLNKSNNDLIVRQKQIDSTIAVYNGKIGELDVKISSIKEKTTIIKEYFHEVSQAADKFTPTQVDSFFKKRYNY